MIIKIIGGGNVPSGVELYFVFVQIRKIIKFKYQCQ